MKIKTNYLFAVIIISLFWAGMIAAISFLEAPVKFTAPSLTLQVGLDVGRHVFGAFNKVEIVLATLLVVSVFLGRMPAGLKIWTSLVAVLLVLECFWLLPVLDERALAIIAGEDPGGSSPHTWYIIFDIIKLVGLILIGYLGIAEMRRRGASMQQD
jgi:hypothetical protein